MISDFDDEIDYTKFDDDFSDDEKNGTFIIVYLNDRRAIGPFESFEKAKEYIYCIPNTFFENKSELEHAHINCDFNFYKLEGVE